MKGQNLIKLAPLMLLQGHFLVKLTFSFFLLQLVQVVKNTVTTSLVWILGLSHAKAIGFYLPV